MTHPTSTKFSVASCAAMSAALLATAGAQPAPTPTATVPSFVSLPCQAQEATPVDPVAQKTFLQEKAKDDSLDQALATRNFSGFVSLLDQYNSVHWERSLGQVAKLPSKDQAKVLARVLVDGPLQPDEDEPVIQNGESLMNQYVFQDKLVQMAYRLLGQKPPQLPGERNHLLTRKEALALAAKLNAW